MTLSERLQSIIDRFVDNVSKAIASSSVDDVCMAGVEAELERPYMKGAFKHVIDPNLKMGSGETLSGYAWWAGVGPKPATVNEAWRGSERKFVVKDAVGNIITIRSRKSRAKLEARKKGYTFGDE